MCGVAVEDIVSVIMMMALLMSVDTAKP